MRLRCRLGIHRWKTESMIEPKDGFWIVYTLMHCQVPDCRYSEPMIYDVERRRGHALAATKPECRDV
jgi:hypothetical protein